MDREISSRIEELVHGFETYALTVMPFGDWAWSMHRETVNRRRQFKCVEEAVESYDFIVRNIGYTLVAWGMDGQAARLVPPDEFYARIKEHGPCIADWEQHSISDLQKEQFANVLRATFDSLSLSKTKSQVVTASKALHHLLPRLVPPIDRRYTSRFFTPSTLKNIREINSPRHLLNVIQGLGEMAALIEEQHGNGYLENLVDKTEYATSESKLIDNAIIGYVIRDKLKAAP